MKGKLYTAGHDINLLKKIDNSGGQFTSEEHAFVVEKEFGTFYSSRDSVLNFSFSRGNYLKFETIPLLMNFVKKNNYSSILSMGSGDCSIEHFLAYCLGENGKVIATDFDSFYVNRAKENFSNITAEYFDFFKDNIASFISDKVKINIDLVVFYGSAYVMDDDVFVKQFSGIKNAGVKAIIDFHGGCLSFRQAWSSKMWETIHDFFKSNPKIKELTRKILLRKPKDSTEKNNYAGKFHGYWRTENELKRLYEKSGWLVAKKSTLPNSYKHIAILTQ
ncbi:MAG: hypothetical protein HQK51_17725 [Oligoflexia bacterium]|nr:hypothetical protein [Oligoflexia bacterium]